MPELGKYAVEVALAYGISLTMLGALIVVYWRRSVDAKKRLSEVEARAKAATGHGG